MNYSMGNDQVIALRNWTVIGHSLTKKNMCDRSLKNPATID